MKLNRSFLSVLSFSVLLFLTACSKSNNNTTGSNGSLSAMVGGSSFTAIKTDGAYIALLNQLFVVGYYIQSQDTTAIQIAIPYIPPVNHPFSTDSTGSVLTYVIDGKRYDASIAFPVSHAIFTLTTADTVQHTIAGTFSGTIYNDTNANDSIVITNGKFS